MTEPEDGGGNTKGTAAERTSGPAGQGSTEYPGPRPPREEDDPNFLLERLLSKSESDIVERGGVLGLLVDVGVRLGSPQLPGFGDQSVGDALRDAKTAPIEESEPGIADEILPRVQSALQQDLTETLIRIDVEKNSGEVVGAKVTAYFDRMHEPQKIDEKVLGLVRQVFQAPKLTVNRSPSDFDGISDKLARPGSVVVIGGRSGTGRTMLAIALLERLKSSAVVEVSTIGFGASVRYDAKRIPPHHHHGYLLELPEDDAEFRVSSDFGAGLPTVQSVLRQRSSHLVVVTTSDQWDRIGIGSGLPLVEIGAIESKKVAAAWLEREDVAVAKEQWVRDPKIVEMIEREIDPRGVMELVGLIIRAGRADQSELPRLDIDEAKADPLARSTDTAAQRRVASVVAARTSWRRELLEWHTRERRTGFQRNFLLAAAILPGAPAGEVYAAARTLSDELGDKVPGPGQKSPGVIEMVQQVQAVPIGNDDLVKFPRPGWEDAALTYFWIDRPESRDKLLDWVVRAPSLISKEVSSLTSNSVASLQQKSAVRMAGFVLTWAIRQRRPDFLEKLVTAWVGDQKLWPAAKEALTRACFDTVIGKETHALLLAWSKRQDVAFRVAAAEMCGDEFGRAFPGKALVRLGHIGESNDPAIFEAARSAMASLWSDETLRVSILTECVHWCRGPERSRRDSGRRSLDAIANIAATNDARFPQLLVQLTKFAPVAGESQELEILTIKGWYELLDAAEVHKTKPVALPYWFDATRHNEEAAETVIRVLRAAVFRRATNGANLQLQLLDRLYEWEPAGMLEEERSTLRHRLAEELILHKFKSGAHRGNV